MIQPGDEDDMPPIVEEQEPGVYIRSNQPDAELDFLWDRERKKSEEHDRFHFGFFIGGAVMGSLITLAACVFFFTGGKFFPDTSPEKPPIIEESRVSTPDQPKAPAPVQASQPTKPLPIEAPSVKPAPETQAATTPQKGFSLPFFGPPKAETTAAAKPVTPPATTYEVKAGDTLGGIAHKFYKSSGPKAVGKIQEANHLKSADALSLGQKLIIPAQ